MKEHYIIMRSEKTSKIETIHKHNKPIEEIKSQITKVNASDKFKTYEVVEDAKIIEIIKWALDTKDRDLKEVIKEIDTTEEYLNSLLSCFEDLKCSLHDQIN